MNESIRRFIAALAALLGLVLPGCTSSHESCPRPPTGPGVSIVSGTDTVYRLAEGSGAVWALRKPRELIQIDPSTGRVIGKPVRLSGVPFGLDVGAGGVWVVTGRGDLFRIDPRSDRTVSTFHLPLRPSGLAVGRGGVWITDDHAGTVSRIDPATGRVTAQQHLPRGPQQVVVGAGGVWVQTEFKDAPLFRLDPSTGRVTDRIDAQLEAVSARAAWVVGAWAPNSGLRRIDPRTVKPEGPTLGFDITPVSVGIAGDQVWVGKYFFYCKLHNPVPEGPPIVSSAWFRVDPATLRALSGPVFVGNDTMTPVFAGGSFWIAPEGGDQGIVRIDLHAAGDVAPTPTPGLPSPATPSP